MACDMFETASARALETPLSDISAEEFIESHDWCDIPISDGQRALVRAAVGLPVEHLDALDRKYFLGIDGPFVPPRRPEKIAIRGGRRSGKSLIAMMLLVLHALTAKLRRKPEPHERAERDGLVGVGHGERLRLAVVAARIGQSIGTFQLAIDKIKRSPKLKRFLESSIATKAVLVRPDGIKVEVEILAAAPRGNNLRSGWFIGCVLDEADFFGEGDAAVNLKDQFDAVEPALVAGGQIFAATSPWDDTGQFATMHAEAFGNPGDVLAFHGSTQRMNPTYPVERIERRRAIDPDFVSREYDAVPMTSGSDQFFPEALIVRACRRPARENYVAVDEWDHPYNILPTGAPHYGGSDPGLRKNSATVAFAKSASGSVELSCYLELIPKRKSPEQIAEDIKKGIPPGLAPSVVFKLFARKGLDYHAECIQGDQWYNDSAIEHMPQERSLDGRTVFYDTVNDNTPSTAEAFTKFRSLMSEGRLVLPACPRLMEQLRQTKMKRGENGQTKIVLPKLGAAHGDLLKAVVLACVQVPTDDPDETREPVRPPLYERVIGAFGSGGRGGGRMVRMALDWVRGWFNKESEHEFQPV